ncbi:MAG: hypothetical protein ABJA76_18590 [Mucilaginibacter sp.]
MPLLKALKHIALIPLFTGVFYCSAQSVRFQFYRTKACTIIEKLDTAYSLYKIPGSIDTDYFPKKGTCYLPGPGRYKISIIGPLLDTVFNIRDTGLFIFKYTEPDHGLYYTGAVDTPPLYSRCDNLLDGYQEYHYPNGNLEMRGIFRHGDPRDSIVIFYRNGQEKKRTTRYPKIIITKTFDSLGHILSVFQTQNISFMTYREYTNIEFYPNGEVRKKESSVGHVRRLEEYYANGKPKTRHTKKYRIEYYENGSQKITYTWAYKRGQITHSRDFTICKTEFDSTGRITRKIVYHQSWSNPVDQPNLATTRSSWIISYDKFERANKVLSVHDMDTEEFMQKYPSELDDDEPGEYE